MAASRIRPTGTPFSLLSPASRGLPSIRPRGRFRDRHRATGEWKGFTTRHVTGHSPAPPGRTERFCGRQVPLAGTGSPTTGAFTPSGEGGVSDAEFPGEAESEEGPDAYDGNIVDRSLSGRAAHGVSVNSGTRTGSHPGFNTGFEGLNFYQQRYARGGNQFSVEPPDQALCVGNGFELEAVNDVLNVFDASGNSVLPDNTFSVSGFHA